MLYVRARLHSWAEVRNKHNLVRAEEVEYKGWYQPNYYCILRADCEKVNMNLSNRMGDGVVWIICGGRRPSAEVRMLEVGLCKVIKFAR